MRSLLGGANREGVDSSLYAAKAISVDESSSSLETVSSVSSKNRRCTFDYIPYIFRPEHTTF